LDTPAFRADLVTDGFSLCPPDDLRRALSRLPAPAGLDELLGFAAPRFRLEELLGFAAPRFRLEELLGFAAPRFRLEPGLLPRFTLKLEETLRAVMSCALSAESSPWNDSLDEKVTLEGMAMSGLSRG